MAWLEVLLRTKSVELIVHNIAKRRDQLRTAHKLQVTYRCTKICAVKF